LTGVEGGPLRPRCYDLHSASLTIGLRLEHFSDTYYGRACRPVLGRSLAAAVVALWRWRSAWNDSSGRHHLAGDCASRTRFCRRLSPWPSGRRADAGYRAAQARWRLAGRSGRDRAYRFIHKGVALVARSKRKTPICGITTAVSEKADKVASHRRLRRVVRLAINPELETPLPLERQLTNTWSMAKDGKAYFDAKANPRLMRK
jgi:hypothetical protein